MQCVLIQLAGRTYGIAIAHVHSIHALRPITRLPGARNHVLGLVNLRGTIMPVLDLRQLLGTSLAEGGARSSDAGMSDRIVVLEVSGVLAGVRVDGTKNVIEVRSDRVQPVASDGRTRFVRAFVEVEHEIVGLLDATSLVEEV